MLVDIVEAKALEDGRLWLRFDDDTHGEIDVSDLVPFDGVFASLRDPAVFAEVRVDVDLGTVVWPGGADLDPHVLYSALTGAPLPGQQMHHAE